MFFSTSRINAVKDAKAELDRYEQRLAELHVKKNRIGLSATQREEYIEQLKRSNELAEEIAEQIKTVQLIFRDYYHDDSRNVSDSTLEQAKNVWFSYTEDDSFAFSWLQEPGWDIEVETSSIYTNQNEIPLVWSLWRADGELAGFVRGNYHIEKSTISFDWKYTYRGYHGDPEEEMDESGEVNIKSFNEVFEDGKID